MLDHVMSVPPTHSGLAGLPLSSNLPLYLLTVLVTISIHIDPSVGQGWGEGGGGGTHWSCQNYVVQGVGPPQLSGPEAMPPIYFTLNGILCFHISKNASST